MTSPAPGADHWDIALKPRMATLFAYGVATVIIVVGVAVALALKNTSTGPVLRTADQFAMVGLAIVSAGAVLLLTRPRLRVGPAGLSVRNMLSYRLIPWDEVVDVSFPPGGRWARVDLDCNEYVAVLAVQAIDRERAVAAMDDVRQLMARYQPDTPGPVPLI